MAKTYAEQLAETETRLAKWIAAVDRVADTGQSYSFTDGDTRRELTRASLKDAQAMVISLQNKVYRLERLAAGATTGNIVHMRGI